MHLPSPSQEQASPVTLHRAPAAMLKSHFAEQTLPHSPPVFLSPGNSRAPGRKKLGARGFAAVLLNTHRVCRKLGEGIRSKTSLERSSIPAAQLRACCCPALPEQHPRAHTNTQRFHGSLPFAVGHRTRDLLQKYMLPLDPVLQKHFCTSPWKQSSKVK